MGGHNVQVECFPSLFINSSLYYIPHENIDDIFRLKAAVYVHPIYFFSLTSHIDFPLTLNILHIQCVIVKKNINCSTWFKEKNEC